MTTNHRFKKVTPAMKQLNDRPKTIVGLVTKYGDLWALMGGVDRFGCAQWRTAMADHTQDTYDFHAMADMERGLKSRCEL